MNGLQTFVHHILSWIMATGASIFLFFGGTHLSYIPQPLPTLTATSTTTTGTLPLASSTTKIPPKNEPTPLPAPAPVAVAPIPTISGADLNTQTRAALVNILCTTLNGGYLNPITGTGVIIDPRGVILTPAHAAQYFLLRDFLVPGNVNCVIRMGSPAASMYTAELLYLPTAWVDANASQIIAESPKGTGENDFAFLIITGRTNPDASLPASFPYIPLSYADPNPGDQMLLAGYPAGFLEGLTIERSLYQTSAYAGVQQLFIFNDNTPWIDLFSVPGTILSQAGASGGAAVRVQDGALSGIIVTSSAATSTANRDLRAITIDHIQHALQAVGEDGITSLLSGNLKAKASAFNTNTAPSLEEKLAQVLKSAH